MGVVELRRDGISEGGRPAFNGGDEANPDTLTALLSEVGLCLIEISDLVGIEPVRDGSVVVAIDGRVVPNARLGGGEIR